MSTSSDEWTTAWETRAPPLDVRVYFACSRLCLGHALAVVLSLALAAAIRSLSCCGTFLSDWELPWLGVMLAWPLWWIPGVVFAVRYGRDATRPWVAATAAWLLAVLPMAVLAWSLRGFC